MLAGMRRKEREGGQEVTIFSLTCLGYLFMNGCCHLRIDGSFSMEDLPSSERVNKSTLSEGHE